jgi:pre-mRNA-splicing factor 38A
VSRAPQIPDCSIVVPRRGRADDDGPLEDGEHRAHIDDKKKEKKEKEKEKEKKHPVTDGTDHPDPEIAEANRLRAALGLKPLRP